MDLIERFADSDDVQFFSAESVVFREGEFGDVMYVVLEGAVEIRVRDQVVDTVVPGGLVGEMALIDLGERSASAVATTDSRLAAIDEAGFISLVQDDPLFSLFVMRLLVERLRKMDAML